MVPQHKVVGGPEQSQIGLLGRAGVTRAGVAQGLDLVVRGRVPLARERWWRGSAKLRRAGQGEGSHSGEPRRQHCRKRRGSWAPLAESGATRERRWIGWEAPVIGSQGDDTGG